MKKYIITAAAIIGFGAMPTFAQAGWGGHHSGMHGMPQADANHDGKITKDEFFAAAKKHAQKMFAHMDANSDGVVDEKDHETRFFDKMDVNHDNMVSRKEFKAFHLKMMKKHHKKGSRKHD